MATTASLASSPEGKQPPQDFKTFSGNGIIAIRREDKNVWERRTPLSPTNVRHLLTTKQVAKVIVQPSSTRCFPDRDYEAAGAEINEDLTEAGTILAVKEVPCHVLIPDRTYMFFSHTVLGEAMDNLPLFDALKKKRIRMIDHEHINGPDGRLVKFGPYAGYAGMIDTLHALGLAMIARGYSTPFLQVSLSKEYHSLDVARDDLRVAGDLIRRNGLPKAMSPMVIGVTGCGSVSQAAQEMLHLLPCKYIEPEALPGLWKQNKVDNHFIYVCVIRTRDLVAPRDPNARFDRHQYRENPELYVPVFHENVAPYLRCIVNCIYWEAKYPKVMSTAQAADLQRANRFPLLVLGDITCDVGGPIEFFVRATTIKNPLYAYDVVKREEIDIQSYDGNGVVVLGVDHLPAEFPAESSNQFGNCLCPLIHYAAYSKDDAPYVQQKEELGPLWGAMLMCRGEMAPNFEYIGPIRTKIAQDCRRKVVLVVGSGRVAGSVIEDIAQLPVGCDIIVIDRSSEALEKTRSCFNLDRFNPSQAPPRIVFTQVDVLSNNPVDSNSADLDKLLMASDLVVSLLPANLHHVIAERSIRAGISVITPSMTSPELKAVIKSLPADRRAPFILSEAGLDPGIGVMHAARLVAQIRAQGGTVTGFTTLFGGLPQPESSDCPLGYRFSWAPNAVLQEAHQTATVRLNGDTHTISGDKLCTYTTAMTSYNGLNLHWIPQGDSDAIAEALKLGPECTTIASGLLRYPGFAPVAHAFDLLGLLNPDARVLDNTAKSETTQRSPSWAKLIARGIPDSFAQPQWTLTERLRRFLTSKLQAEHEALANCPIRRELHRTTITGRQAPCTLVTSVQGEVDYIMWCFDHLGLLSEVNTPGNIAGVFDALAHLLSDQLKYTASDREFVIHEQRITAEFHSQKIRRTYNCSLLVRAEDQYRTATSCVVGRVLSALTKIIFSGKLASTLDVTVPPPSPGGKRPPPPTARTGGPIASLPQAFDAVLAEVEQNELVFKTRLVEESM